MNSRERVIRSIKFTSPDRAPIMHRTLPGAFRRYGQALEDLYARYPSDVLLSPKLRAPFRHADPAGEGAGAGLVKDVWGCTWQKVTDDYAGLVVGHPLEDWSAMDTYRWPNPATGEEPAAAELVATVGADGHQHYVMAAVGTIYHQYTFLRNMENGLMDVVEETPQFAYLLERLTDFVVARARFWCQFEEVDGILVEDDWGSQENLLISPAKWRKWFKPLYTRVIQAIHAGGKFAHLHSDGQVRSIIPDLIEIGWDEINLQVWTMDVKELGREFNGKICFRADLDRQYVLPFGTVNEVEEHVRQTYAALGSRRGGYIGYGQVGPDVPLRNAEAMLSALSSLGR
jgi:hypothetical protein